MKAIILNNPLPNTSYYNEVEVKNQIVLHHSVSDPFNTDGDVNSWRIGTNHIATPFIIRGDGTIVKTFPSNVWANHLGIKDSVFKKYDLTPNNINLNKKSIAIEIDGWGGLTCDIKGNLFNAYGKPISDKLEVVSYHFRGYNFFQKYTALQIESLEELLTLLMKEYKIPSYGIKDKNFDVRKDSLEGVNGIFSHTSYRSDKSDLYPDKDLIKMLNRL